MHLMIYRDGGYLSISTEVEQDSVYKTIKSVFEETERFQKFLVNETELNAAKAHYRARLSFTHTQTLAHWLRKVFASGLPVEWLDNIPRDIDAVTKEDIQRVAQRYLTTNPTISVIGDYYQIQDQLQRIGKVSYYNVE